MMHDYIILHGLLLMATWASEFGTPPLFCAKSTCTSANGEFLIHVLTYTLSLSRPGIRTGVHFSGRLTFT